MRTLKILKKQDEFLRIRPFLTDVVQQKSIALRAVKYLGKKPYLKDSSFKYFRGIPNDIEDINRVQTHESYWLKWPGCWESIEYLRKLGFKTREDIDQLFSLISKLPEWEKDMIKVYLSNQSADWNTFCSFALKRTEWLTQFNIDYENELYDKEGYDENDDYY